MRSGSNTFSYFLEFLISILTKCWRLGGLNRYSSFLLSMPVISTSDVDCWAKTLTITLKIDHCPGLVMIGLVKRYLVE